MKVSFDKSFLKSIQKLTHKPALLLRVKAIILDCESADSIQDINKVKKLKGFKTYYRIRVNDYRIGFEFLDNEITFITIAHRKEIYNIFP